MTEKLEKLEKLEKCDCLEQEAQESYLLFTNSLKESKEKLAKECQCEVSNKPRTPYYDSDNYGYTYCEICETKIKGAGKMGVVKNRNDPRFWGLEVKEKVLCLKCLAKFQERMPISKKYTFNKYLKRGYWLLLCLLLSKKTREKTKQQNKKENKPGLKVSSPGLSVPHERIFIFS